MNMEDDRTLAEIGEFGLIRLINELVEQRGRRAPGLTTGIGDDTAAFIPDEESEYLLTCDCLVEGRHFLPGLTRPEHLGRRAMTANISDIGAMGGLPLYALVSLGLKPGMRAADILALYRGFLEELNPLDATIAGGNITKTEGPFFMDITLVGKAPKGRLLLRSAARPGDAVLVTGHPGRAAAGVELLRRRPDDAAVRDNPLVRAYTLPSHRAREGAALARSGLAGAVIDISDGFAGDLAHICEESATGARILEQSLPLSPELEEEARRRGVPPADLVLRESDDYELIITCRPDRTADVRSVISAVSDVPVTEVGRMTAEAGKMELVLPDGSSRPLAPRGWDHFKQ